jgi:hypothetical protein
MPGAESTAMMLTRTAIVLRERFGASVETSKTLSLKDITNKRTN